MWASSCWKHRSRVSPPRLPEASALCRAPKSASRRGSSRQDLGRWANIRLRVGWGGLSTAGQTGPEACSAHPPVPVPPSESCWPPCPSHSPAWLKGNFSVRTVTDEKQNCGPCPVKQVQAPDATRRGCGCERAVTAPNSHGWRRGGLETQRRRPSRAGPGRARASWPQLTSAQGSSWA